MVIGKEGNSTANDRPDISGDVHSVLPAGVPVNAPLSGGDVFVETKRLAVSLFNIQRGDGHLRIPGTFPLLPSRSLNDGTGQSYAFYSDLAHAILVALCLQRSMDDGVMRRFRVRQALMFEVPEAIASDMAGPFNGTDFPNPHPIDLMTPKGEETYRLNLANIMARDIESWTGRNAPIPGVNISRHFRENRWMVPALVYAVNVTPDGYVNALRYGDVMASGRDAPAVRLTDAEFRLYAENVGIVYDPEDLPLWKVWLQAMMRSPDHIRNRMLAKAKGDRQALSSSLIVGDDNE